MTSLRDRCALIIALKVKGNKSASWFCSLEAMSRFLNVGHPQRPRRGRACQRAVAAVRLHSPSLWGRVLPGGSRSPRRTDVPPHGGHSDFLQDARDARQVAGAGHARAALCTGSAPASCLWPECRETLPHLPGAAPSSECLSNSWGSGSKSSAGGTSRGGWSSASGVRECMFQIIHSRL